MELIGSYFEAEGVGWILPTGEGAYGPRQVGARGRSLPCNTNKKLHIAQTDAVPVRTRWVIDAPGLGPSWCQCAARPRRLLRAKATHAGDQSIIHAGAIHTRHALIWTRRCLVWQHGCHQRP